MRVSIPGKIFLMGEYGVLVGLPAWVVAVGPRFTLESDVPEYLEVHSESPAGRYLEKSSPIRGRFTDPWKGLGGFGRSTAEFALAAYSRGIRDPLNAWEEYKRVNAGTSSGIPPSGADLIAQWSGGAIEWNPEKKSITDLSAKSSELPLLVFSATHLENRKTLTHSHLMTLGLTGLREGLTPSVTRAFQGLHEKNHFEVGKAITDFAVALSSLGLEAPFVKKEREALLRIPGVIGVKGCGALQTDATLIMVDSLENGRRIDAVVEYAEREFGLKLLSRGLKLEPGIQEDR